MESQLQLLKLLYFLSGFSGASFGRFATLFYLDRGLLAHEIGIVEALQPLCAAVGNQLFGFAADRFQRKKLSALVGRALSTAALLTLPFVGRRFESILPVMMLVAFFGVGAGVLDAYTLDLLGQDRRGEYGRYRLWTAVSWGLGNALMGVVAEHNFDLNFVVFGVGNAVSMVIMGLALPRRTSEEAKLVARRLTRQREIAAAKGAAAGDDGGSDGDGDGSNSDSGSNGDGDGSSGDVGSTDNDGCNGNHRHSTVGASKSLRSSICTARFLIFLFEMSLLVR